MMPSCLKEHALKYVETLGLSIIPIRRSDKKPYIKWEQYQEKAAPPSQIEEWWSRWPDANIGLVTGKASGVVVIDIDVLAEAEPALRKIIPGFDDIVPMSETPRGGKHLFFLHPGQEISNNSKTVVPGSDFRGDGGYSILPPSLNDKGVPYRWYEGKSLFELMPPSFPVLYLKLVEEKQAKAVEIKWEKDIFTEGRRDQDLFHTANCMVKGGMDQDFAKDVLYRVASTCEPPFPQQETDIKIDSAMKRAIRKERVISNEVDMWIDSTDGYFNIDEFYRDAGITSTEEKHAARIAFLRLVEAEILEKHGNKRGVYRRLDGACKEIDFIHAENAPKNYRWPFNIEDYVKIYPKNIVLIAGMPNAGKTSFLLNFVKMNMMKHDIHYFSSEMDGTEFNVRLSMDEQLKLTDWKFHAKERTGNFADVIQPNSVNIIDFLEIYDEFYKVSFYIRQIYDKLDKGIAIIAIQKNPKTDFGLGGLRGLEKPRLYLAMDPGYIKIVKAKNWSGDLNPNGLYQNFKLIQGLKIVNNTGWRRN